MALLPPGQATYPLHKGAFLALGPKWKGKSFMESPLLPVPALPARGCQDFPASFPSPQDPGDRTLASPSSPSCSPVFPLSSQLALGTANHVPAFLIPQVLLSHLQVCVQVLPPQRELP